MTNLFEHQKVAVQFLAKRPSAMLADVMGLGKTRSALVAALRLHREQKIDRVLVLAPAAVRYSWMTEVQKLSQDGQKPIIWCSYNVKKQTIAGERFADHVNLLPILVLSYALLPQSRHVQALESWCEDGKALLVCDESSFLKNRTAKQTKGSAAVGRSCLYRWLLTGTPIANSPLDLWGQGLVMSNGSARGPLTAFRSFYHFRARYAVLKLMNMGQLRFQQVVGYQNLDELTKRFAPYVLRREKKDCLDLPPKSYVVREVALSEATWKIYQELKREALLVLKPECHCDCDNMSMGNFNAKDCDCKCHRGEDRPEPNAAVRLLRLCQLTSGHVGGYKTDASTFEVAGEYLDCFAEHRDVSSEKLDYIADSILDGELAQETALIVWCRWRRERERLAQALQKEESVDVYEIFGGQSQKTRDEGIRHFQEGRARRRILLAQQHAGGFGLNLTAASVAVYLSNTFSYSDRIQSEDRIHRIGQHEPCLYIDVVAVGPRGQRTVDHHVLDCLREKKDIATQTCSAWRKALSEA
jgi:SNF2 family DNA or RNA helicase